MGPAQVGGQVLGPILAVAGRRPEQVDVPAHCHARARRSGEVAEVPGDERPETGGELRHEESAARIRDRASPDERERDEAVGQVQRRAGRGERLRVRRRRRVVGERARPHGPKEAEQADVALGIEGAVLAGQVHAAARGQVTAERSGVLRREIRLVAEIPDLIEGAVIGEARAGAHRVAKRRELRDRADDSDIPLHSGVDDVDRRGLGLRGRGDECERDEDARGDAHDLWQRSSSTPVALRARETGLRHLTRGQRV